MSKILSTDYVNVDEIYNTVYPIGSIYMSVNNVDPATLFGGTWEQIKDTFLLSAGDTYSAGSTGGEATHTLTISEMPSHDHNHYKYNSNGGSTSSATVNQTSMDTGWAAVPTGKVGGSKPHNNMPPYLTVYMWKRTA